MSGGCGCLKSAENSIIEGRNEGHRDDGEVAASPTAVAARVVRRKL